MPKSTARPTTAHTEQEDIAEFRQYATKLVEYYKEVSPFLADMASLVTLYRQSVWHQIGATPTHRGLTPDDFQVFHVWSNTEMELYYRRLEALIREIRENYFGSGSD